ncbi:MAG: STAS domain-containing protein [Limnothrix sp.]
MTFNQQFSTLYPQHSLNAGNVSELRQSLAAAINNSQAPEILVNLENVELIDSAAMVALAQATRLAQNKGKYLGLCCANSQISMVLELTQLERFVNVFTTESEFFGRNYQLMAA